MRDGYINKQMFRIAHANGRAQIMSFAAARQLEWPMVRYGALLALLVCHLAGQPVSAATPNVLVEYRFAPDAGPIIVPVSFPQIMVSAGAPLQGSPLKLNLALDTGSSLSAIDIRYAAFLGSLKGHRISSTPTGTFKYYVYSAHQMDLGGLSLTPRRDMACCDLKPFATSLRVQIDGLLGMDVLRSLVVSIDFERGVVQFLRSVPADAGEMIEIGYGTTVWRDCPFVRASIGDRQNLVFFLDTCAYSTLSGDLEPALFDALINGGSLKVMPLPAPVTGIQSSATTRVAQAAEFNIKHFCHKDLLFYRLSKNSLSLGYLSRYNVVFDFPKSQLYLRPNRRFNRRDPYDRLGLTLRSTPSGIEIERVVPGQAAERAGVKAGDQLHTISGVAAAGLTVNAAQRLLSTEDHHVLECVRDGATIRIVVKAEQ